MFAGLSALGSAIMDITESIIVCTDCTGAQRSFRDSYPVRSAPLCKIEMQTYSIIII